jgi:hypothetical protein
MRFSMHSQMIQKLVQIFIGTIQKGLKSHRQAPSTTSESSNLSDVENLFSVGRKLRAKQSSKLVSFNVSTLSDVKTIGVVRKRRPTGRGVLSDVQQKKVLQGHFYSQSFFRFSIVVH